MAHIRRGWWRKEKRFLVETRTQSTATSTQMSRRHLCKHANTVGKDQKLTFSKQRWDVEIFLFIYFVFNPQIIFADTPRSGAPAVTRGFKGICARRFLLRTRLPARATENKSSRLLTSLLRRLTHYALSAGSHRAHLTLFTLFEIISEEPRYSSVWAFLRVRHPHSRGVGGYKTNVWK